MDLAQLKILHFETEEGKLFLTSGYFECRIKTKKIAVLTDSNLDPDPNQYEKCDPVPNKNLKKYFRSTTLWTI